MDPGLPRAGELQGRSPCGVSSSTPDTVVRSFEIFTCCNCGTALRAPLSTDNLDDPRFFLWAEAGGAFRTLAGECDELEPLTCYQKNCWLRAQAAYC